MRTPSDHIVVAGAGMAGLLLTLAVAEAGHRVTLVDRDPVTPTPEVRPGTPQAGHVHALLPGGLRALEGLVPGFTDELAAAGACVGDVLRDTRICFSGHELRRGTSGLPLVQASRALIEAVVRRRVLDHPSVTTCERCDVVGLLVDAGTVHGVRLLRRADHSAEEERAADVVVDATGRLCRSSRWLRSAGLQGHREDQVRVDVHYATRVFRRPVDGSAVGAIHAPTPEHRCGGAVSLVEGHRMLVTLAGVCGERPPVEPAAFTAYAASLRPTHLVDAIAGGEPLGPPRAFSFPAAVRRHVDGPPGLLVVGDALCSLNPVYGQGISVAALQAAALARHLRRHPVRDTGRCQRVVTRVTEVPWRMAAGADLVFPEVDGPRTRSGTALARYVARVHAAAARDVAVGRAFLRVTGLVAPAGLLVRPDILARVIVHGGTTAGRRERPGTRSERAGGHAHRDHQRQ